MGGDGSWPLSTRDEESAQHAALAELLHGRPTALYMTTPEILFFWQDERVAANRLAPSTLSTVSGPQVSHAPG